MRNNELLKQGETIIRVLDSKDRQAFVIDCKRQTMPRWVDSDALHDYTVCPDEELGLLPDINDLEPASRQFACEHFTYISGVLPFITDKSRYHANIRRKRDKQANDLPLSVAVPCISEHSRSCSPKCGCGKAADRGREEHTVGPEYVFLYAKQKQPEYGLYTDAQRKIL